MNSFEASSIRVLSVCAAFALAACSGERGDAAKPGEPPAAASEAPAEAPVQTDAPAGEYVLDKSHASLLFRVDHLGFSRYTARFKNFDAQLAFDPANPTAASLTATVDAASIETDFPDPKVHDFNAQLRSEQWLNTAQHPTMTYRSTRIEARGPRSFRIHGDLTLRGVTRPVTLDATFNGGYAGHPLDPRARIGFSAHGFLNRSEFGMGFGVPEPGSKMGVGDAVEVIIETEFNGPPLANAPARQPTQS